MNRKKFIKRIGIGLAVFIVVGLVVMVVITGHIVFQNTSQLSSNDLANREHSMENFAEKGFDYDSFTSKYTIERLEITSSYEGHKIPADLIYSGQRDNDTVILIHGLGGNRVGMLCFAPVFLENGYNVLVYDQRSAGENFAQYTTCGYLESYDTSDYVAYLDEEISKDKEIHLFGMSMGAATAAISVSRGNVEKRVSSVILDCPIGDMGDVFAHQMSGMDIGLPLDFLVFSGSLYNRMALGFSYGDVSPKKSLENSDIPVLILASKADEVAPFFMAQEIHAAVSTSTLAFVEDSGHCDLIYDYPDWYEQQIVSFINSRSE